MVNSSSYGLIFGFSLCWNEFVRELFGTVDLFRKMIYERETIYLVPIILSRRNAVNTEAQRATDGSNIQSRICGKHRTSNGGEDDFGIGNWEWVI